MKAPAAALLEGVRYMGKMLDLQKQRGDPMRTGLTNKVKLDIVKRAENLCVPVTVAGAVLR